MGKVYAERVEPGRAGIRGPVKWRRGTGKGQVEDYRGSSGTITVLVESRSATLTLTGPATSEAGRRIRLSGSLLLDGTTPKPGEIGRAHV